MAVNVPAIRETVRPRVLLAVVVTGALTWTSASLAADVAHQPAVNRYQTDTATLLLQLQHSGIPTLARSSSGTQGPHSSGSKAR